MAVAGVVGGQGDFVRGHAVEHYGRGVLREKFLVDHGGAGAVGAAPKRDFFGANGLAHQVDVPHGMVGRIKTQVGRLAQLGHAAVDLLGREHGARTFEQVAFVAVERVRAAGAAHVDQHDVAGAPAFVEEAENIRSERTGILTGPAGQKEKRRLAGCAIGRLQNGNLKRDFAAGRSRRILRHLEGKAAGRLGNTIEPAGTRQAGVLRLSRSRQQRQKAGEQEQAPGLPSASRYLVGSLGHEDLRKEAALAASLLLVPGPSQTLQRIFGESSAGFTSASATWHVPVACRLRYACGLGCVRGLC